MANTFGRRIEVRTMQMMIAREFDWKNYLFQNQKRSETDRSLGTQSGKADLNWAKKQRFLSSNRSSFPCSVKEATFYFCPCDHSGTELQQPIWINVFATVDLFRGFWLISPFSLSSLFLLLFIVPLDIATNYLIAFLPKYLQMMQFSSMGHHDSQFVGFEKDRHR